MNEYSYTLSSDKDPIMYVDCNEPFTINVLNAFGKELNSESELEMCIKTKQHHPVTGPIYIRNVFPGDSISVNIIDIEPNKSGYQCLSSSSGIVRIQPFKRNFKIVQFTAGEGVVEYDNIRFVANPSIGVIGVANSESTRSGRTSWTGGNIDINKLIKNSRIILPCEFPGGLLYLGDLHLLQGNGELSGVAFEVSGKITISVTKDEKQYKFPILELKEGIGILGYGTNIEEAIRCATNNAITYICKEYGMKYIDAYMLLSAIGDVVLGHITGKIVSCAIQINYSYAKVLRAKN